MEKRKDLSADHREEVLKILKARFEENMKRHEGLEWDKVQEKLEKNPEKLWFLYQMEMTGGEPDIVAYDTETNEYIFYDCSKESPKGRRSTCYDYSGGRETRRGYIQKAMPLMAASMGIELLNEEEYRELQKLGEFDTKTSAG